MNLLLFGGTSEGRLLAERMGQISHLSVTICVATEYGREVGAFPPQFTVIAQRLSQRDMERMMRDGKWDLVVDATHPYAAEASANIQQAARSTSRRYLRLLREKGMPMDGCRFFEDTTSVAAALVETTGNVLLTTGSKELSAYTAVPNYKKRMYPRILPTAESIERCAKLGFAHSHIIAMQGPFSVEMNKAILAQYQIRYMVTKDGGKEGGFAEKMEACQNRGVEVFVVKRPTNERGEAIQKVWAEILAEWEREQ